MLLTIHDANLQKIGFIDNEKQETLNFYNDTWTRNLGTASSTFEFTVSKKQLLSDTANKPLYNQLNERSFVSFKHKGQTYLFNIMKVEENERWIRCYCENLNLELINEYTNPYKADRPLSFAEYLDVFEIPQFAMVKIGVNEISDQKRTLEWEGQDTKLARLLSLANKFDAEVEFVTQLNDDSSIKQIVLNVYHKADDSHTGVGRIRGDIRLTFEKNIKSMTRKIDKTEVYTLVVPYGKSKESHEGEQEVRVYIDNLPPWEEKDDNGIVIFKQEGVNLYAPHAADLYPSTFGVSTQSNKWIRKDLEVDSDNPNVIRAAGIANLRKHAYPAITYEVDGFIDVEIGDTITIHDKGFTPALDIRSRAVEQKISFSNPTNNKTTFGNFKELENRTSGDLRSVFEQMVENSRPYNILVSTDNGVMFKNNTGRSTISPTLKRGNQTVPATYRFVIDGSIVSSGLTYTVKASDITKPTVITISAWVDNKEVASEEITFLNVSDGSDGKTPYFHTAWSYSADGKDRFTTVYPNLNLLEGTDTFDNFNPNSSNNSVSAITKTKESGINNTVIDVKTSGEAFAVGLYRPNACNITAGQTITVSFMAKSLNDTKVLVGFENLPNGHKMFTITPNWKIYTYTFTATSSGTPNFMIYGWDMVAGKEFQVYNPKVEEGSTATPWMPSASEVTTDDFPKYIGQYTNYNQVDSPNPRDYTWSLIRGNDGKQGPKGDRGNDGIAGKDGVGLKTTTITYGLSDSDSTQPTDWTSQPPTLIKGKYLWTKTQWTYTDGSSETGYQKTYIAKDGNKGNDGLPGKDGVGIRNTTITYAVGTSGTVAPTSGWSSQVPNVKEGQYLWTKTVWDYTDNTSETGYSVAKMGETGPKGDRGPQGPQGDQGIPGPKGADGRTQYTHIAYANSADGSKDFSTSDSNREYIGIYVDFNINDSTTPSDYSWTLVKGADGTQGTPGKPGADGKTPYFHTAWSYSADGKDRFTTVYPNLNLFDGTSDKTSSSTGSGWNIKEIGVYNTPKVGQEYTFSVEVPEADHDVWLEVWRYNNVGWGIDRRIDKLASNRNVKSGEKVHATFTWPDPDNSGATQIAVSLAWPEPTYTGSYSYRNAKLEIGNTPTPWMPSASEVTTADYPSFIGQYTNYTQVDSPNPQDYTWSLIRGNDGKQGPKGDRGNDGIAGKDGVGLKTTTITYGISDSDTVMPNNWSSQVPTLVKGKYLWTKTVWTYTDNSSETGYQKTYIAKDGNNGKDGLPGKDGVGIRNTTITYAQGTSGTVAPTNGWSSQVPNVPAGQYLWTKTVWDYTDNTSETGYSVAKMGEKGPKGDRGERGLQGPQGDQGIPGPKGADGRTQYTHIAYANSPDGNKDFSTSDSNREYIGIYVDFEESDSVDPSKYNWTLVKGADGTQGVPGPKGADGRTPYFHTAWAYSADGKDRFTTTYPNLNLLDDTATFDNFNPNSSNNSVSSITKTVVSGITNTVMDVKTSGNAHAVGLYRSNSYSITVGQTLTISFMARADNDTKVLVGFENLPNGHKMFTISTKWELYTYTFTATTSVSPHFMIYGWDMAAGKHFQVYNPKVEEGSTATPWMPSASEVTTADFPKYIGQYTNYNQVDSPNPQDYTWSLIRGNDGKAGPKGPQGDQGIPGPKGADGKTQYTHIAYADTISGSGFSQTDNNKAYIGMYQDFNAEDSKNPQDYRWSKWKGSDGRDGIPGPKGADGRTPYVHFAYADSADGRTGFSLTQTGRKRYLGVLTNFIKEDSTNPSDYTWNDTAGSISVGGRNLLVKTNQGVTNWDWQLSDDDKSVEEVNVDGIRAVKLIKGSTTANTGWNFIRYEGLLRELIQPNTKYVLSFDVKPSVDVTFDATLVQADFKEAFTDTVSMNKALANQWNKVSCVLTSKETLPNIKKWQVVHIDGMPTTNGNWLIIKNIKLEEGNIPTQWTPAIEDIQDEIDTKADDALTQAQLNRLSEINSVMKAELEAKASLATVNQWIKAYQDFVNANDAEREQAQKALADASARVVKLENNLNDMSERWNFIDNYMAVSNDGLVIGKKDNSSSIMFNPNGRISMYSAGSEVMYISQGVIHIENGIFSKTIQIGRFREEQDLLNPDRNVIRYVGGA